jgi:hypothetical protein
VHHHTWLSALTLPWEDMQHLSLERIRTKCWGSQVFQKRSQL